MKPLRIVFMGTPDFAVPTLAAIDRSEHQVVGVVSQPDRPRGRGRKLQHTAVKAYAAQAGLEPVLQPEKMKDPEFQEQLRELDADVFVVVAFRILPVAVFEMAPMGTINLHPSLLPKLRGAAPLNWAIINGQRTTGISTIFIRKEIDAGNIILQREQQIAAEDTVGDIHDRFAEIGAEMIVESLNLISTGSVTTRTQDPSLVTPAPKITREMCYLDFAQPADKVRNWIHGLSPFPGAVVNWRKKQLKLLRAEVFAESGKLGEPGEVLDTEDGHLRVACARGALNILELQLQGRNKMKTGDFLRGNDMGAGEQLKQISGDL